MAEHARSAMQRHAMRRQLVHGVIGTRLGTEFPELRGLRLTSIDVTALKAWRETWADHPDRRCRWDWEVFGRMYRKHFARFETAIWRDNVLAGLSIGRMSASRQIVSVNFVEGAPHEGGLRGRVMMVVSEVAVGLGDYYGSRAIRFTEPNHWAQAKLAAMGYTYVAQQPGMRYSFDERILR